MSCGHCGLEPHANLLCPCGITILTDRNAIVCMKHFIYLVLERRGESNPAANNPCPVCLSTPSDRLSRLPACHASLLWGAGESNPG